MIRRSNPSLGRPCLFTRRTFHNWITFCGSSFQRKLFHSVPGLALAECSAIRLRNVWKPAHNWNYFIFRHSIDSLTTSPWRIELHARHPKVSISVVFSPHHQVLPSRRVALDTQSTDDRHNNVSSASLFEASIVDQTKRRALGEMLMGTDDSEGSQASMGSYINDWKSHEPEPNKSRQMTKRSVSFAHCIICI